ncbi:unnamed protein product [Arctogadus glacialis]
MRAPSSTCAWPLPWLLLLLLSYRAGAATGQLFRTPLEGDITPRLTITTSALGCFPGQRESLQSRTQHWATKGEVLRVFGRPRRVDTSDQSLEGCRRFQAPAAVDYGSLLLEADGGRLYVGARGAAFSLDARDISANTTLAIQWATSQEKKQQCLAKGRDNKTECFNHIRFLQRFNSTHLYMCGTYAFSPLCVYVEEEPFVMSSQPEEGKEKCPYGPATGYTGLIVEQQMYSAARYEFRSFPDLRLNGPPLTLKTEDAPIRWLNDADFVGSALVRESVDSIEGDDDKIYFFFTEGSEEQTGGIAHGRVARVARVCKKRWTTFLKARLVCSHRVRLPLHRCCAASSCCGSRPGHRLYASSGWTASAIVVKFNRYKWAEPSSVKGASASRIRCLTVGGAILCERRVRVQGSDMGPLRIRCMTVELSEAELILWAAPKRMRQLTRVWRLEGGSA